MLLSDDPDTTDLRAKVQRAWQEFHAALGKLLPTLPAGGQLRLVLDPTASGAGAADYEVTVTALLDGRIRAYAVGNASLPKEYQLDRTAVAELVALGWSPPGVEPDSGNRFGLTTNQIPALATVLTRTLRDIYGAPHPAFLRYEANDATGEPLSEVALGTARAGRAVKPPPPEPSAPTGPADPQLLRDQVRMVIAGMQHLSPEQLTADPDGDIGIRAGTAMVFVTVRDNPPLVDVRSPVLTGVTPSEQLYERLSELTNRMPVGRLYYVRDTVWASVPVFGRDFRPSHLVLAIHVMTGLADELDDRLQQEFGGRRFFADDDHHRPEAPGTGMYL